MKFFYGGEKHGDIGSNRRPGANGNGLVHGDGH